jgi:hypothetical protein
MNNIRNDLKPNESIMVGPGLNLDPSIPAAGGFHEFTRILPNNVNDYKSNQLQGQVIKGKYFSAGLPTSYPGIGTSAEKTPPGITKNRPNSYYDQVRLPTMTTKMGWIQGNLDYQIPLYQADFKPNNASRDQISYGLGNLEYQNGKYQNGKYQNGKYQNSEGFSNSNSKSFETVCVNESVSIGQGPLKALVSQTPSRSETFMSFENNIKSKADCNSQPIGNPERSTAGFSNIASNWYVNETDRGTVHPQNVMQMNLNIQNKAVPFWTAIDEPSTTTKETTQFAYAGNVSRPADGAKFWTAIDEPTTTTKETTQFAYAGNVSRPADGATFWTAIDEPTTTTKETTQFAFSGNPQKTGFVETSRFMFG